MTFQRYDVPPEVTGAFAPNTKPVEPEAPSKEAGAVATPTPSSQPAAAPSTENRPTWLPEKFKSPEELSKAYAELERKQSGKPEEIPAPVVNLDFAPFTQEFSDRGELSEESFGKLEAMGLPKGVVTQYIEGAKALAEQQVTSLTSEIGGKEAYSQMITWASRNLKPEQITAYNTAVSANDPQQQALAIRGLYAQYREAAGPTLLSGKASGGSAAAPFESWAQVKQAMSDKRYATDPAYRKTVTERLANSKTL
jgi:hypothetical protein